MYGNSRQKPPHAILGVRPDCDPISLLSAFQAQRVQIQKASLPHDEVAARRLQRLEDAACTMLADLGYIYHPDGDRIQPAARQRPVPEAPRRTIPSTEKLALRVRANAHFKNCSDYAAFQEHKDALVDGIMADNGRHALSLRVQAMFGNNKAAEILDAERYLRYPSPTLHFNNHVTLLRNATLWRDAAHVGAYHAIDTEKLAADEAELAFHQEKMKAAKSIILREKPCAP